MLRRRGLHPLKIKLPSRRTFCYRSLWKSIFMKASLGGLGVSKTTYCMLTIHQNKCLLFFISRQENMKSEKTVWKRAHNHPGFQCGAAGTLQRKHCRYIMYTPAVLLSAAHRLRDWQESLIHTLAISHLSLLFKKSHKKHILLRPPLHISVASTRRARRHLRCDQRTPCPSCTNRLVPLEPLLVSRSWNWDWKSVIIKFKLESKIKKKPTAAAQEKAFKSLKVVLYHFKLTRFGFLKELYQAFPLLLALLSFSRFQ